MMNVNKIEEIKIRLLNKDSRYHSSLCDKDGVSYKEVMKDFYTCHALFKSDCADAFGISLGSMNKLFIMYGNMKAYDESESHSHRLNNRRIKIIEFVEALHAMFNDSGYRRDPGFMDKDIGVLIDKIQASILLLGENNVKKDRIDVCMTPFSYLLHDLKKIGVEFELKINGKLV